MARRRWSRAGSRPRGDEPAAAGEGVVVVRAAIGGGHEAAGHDRRQARGHRPALVAAGRPRRGDELAATMPDLPRRLCEQELGAELKSDLHAGRGLQREFTVAAVEPAGLPSVGLLGQVILGARGAIPALARPREGLVQALAARLGRPRGEHHAGLELAEPRHHLVVGRDGGAPGRGIDLAFPEHLPLAERHLRPTPSGDARSRRAAHR